MEAIDESKLAPGIYGEIDTDRGVMLAQLYYREVPLTVASFVGLAEGTLSPKPGKPFFDGLTFHRVVPGFVVQGGDPKGTGEGGPGYKLSDEFNLALSHDGRGVLSMANEGPDTDGSQFFITLAATPRLDFLHSVFGRLISGFDVLAQIKQGDAMTVKIHRVGAEAQAFRADHVALEILMKRLPEPVDPGRAGQFFKDLNQLLPHDPPREKILNNQLANLARFTRRKKFIRFLRTAPLPHPDAPKGLAAGIASSLWLPPDAELAVYIADQDLWDVWIGDRALGSHSATQRDERERLIAGCRKRAAETVADMPVEKRRADALWRAQLDSMAQEFIVQSRRESNLNFDPAAQSAMRR